MSGVASFSLALTAMAPLNRQVVAQLGGTALRRRGDRLKRVLPNSAPAITGVHSSSSPAMVRRMRVLPWPRSPSNTTSWPASSERSSCGITVDSRPTMPTHGSSPLRSAVSRLCRISSRRCRFLHGRWTATPRQCAGTGRTGRRSVGHGSNVPADQAPQQRLRLLRRPRPR